MGRSIGVAAAAGTAVASATAASNPVAALMEPLDLWCIRFSPFGSIPALAESGWEQPRGGPRGREARSVELAWSSRGFRLRLPLRAPVVGRRRPAPGPAGGFPGGLSLFGTLLWGWRQFRAPGPP